MKIGIDGRFWNQSGVGRYIRNLVWELNKIDKRNEYVLFLSEESRIKNQELRENWKIVYTGIKWHTVGEQMNFPSILNKYNLDLVHFPYFSLPIFYNRPFVVTIHDLILHHFASGKATTLPKPFYYSKLVAYKFIMQQAAKKARKILSVSEATKEEIIDHLHIKPEKIVVTYEGADEKVVKKTKNEFSHAYFLYVGNAYPHKNLESLIHAFSSLPDSKIKLVIVGKEDYFQKKIRSYVASNFRNPNILFLSDVDDLKLSSLYQHAKALVFPSLMEGFGLPLLEAMANRCLVLASDIPPFREICEDSAVYFDPTDVESIKHTLMKVLSGDIDIKTFKESGIKRAAFFSWQKMAKETLAVYESCSTD